MLGLVVDNPERVGPVEMVGFDETVMQPAHRRRRRRFVTAVVDVGTGQILDVFEGRDARQLRAWMQNMPRAWLAAIQVVSVDPHEGYRSAVINPDPATGLPSPLEAVMVVVDPFHICRLANTAVTRCRQRVQQATLEHRGWKGDPLYDIRKLLLLGAERIDEVGWERLHAALDAGDPDDEVRDTWVANEKVRAVYQTDDAELAAGCLDDAIDWCTQPEASVEQRRLAKTLRRWRTAILAHHRTGASNGPVEAANLLIKQVKRSGRGFRNVNNYRLRILLAGGANPLRVTNAHCLRNHEEPYAWFPRNSYVVTPAAHNNTGPYGSCGVTHRVTRVQWRDQTEIQTDWDYGAIKLNCSFNTGNMGFLHDARNPVTDDRKRGAVTGYPNMTMHESWGDIEYPFRQQVWYSNWATHGMSGSPRWNSTYGQCGNCVHAINWSADGEIRAGVRINQTVFDDLFRWKYNW